MTAKYVYDRTLCQREIGSCQLTFTIGKLLANKAGTVTTGADPMAHFGTVNGRHGVSMVPLMEMTVAAAR